MYEKWIIKKICQIVNEIDGGLILAENALPTTFITYDLDNKMYLAFT